MIVNNRVCKLLGTEYPLLQGGMAWVADAALAAAVSNAGGIGIIAAAATPPEILDQEILKAKGLTDRPFGLNIMLMSPTAPDALELAVKHRLPIVTTGAGSPGKVLECLKPLGSSSRSSRPSRRRAASRSRGRTPSWRRAWRPGDTSGS